MEKEKTKNFNTYFEKSKQIFLSKFGEYGISWRWFRYHTLADQIFIKAFRIRTLGLEFKSNFNDETLENDLYSILNYSLIGMIKIKLLENGFVEKDLSKEILEKVLDEIIENWKQTIKKKNSDYGESWKLMLFDSFIDLILVKTERIKSLGLKKDLDLVLIYDCFFDIISYSIFSLFFIEIKKSK